MTSDQIDATGRLRAWIRDYGHEKQPAFIQDLQAVLDLAERGLDSEIVIAGMQGTIDGLRSKLATKEAILKETEANLGIEDGQGSIGIEIKHLRSQLAAVTAERDLAIKAIGDAAFALWGNGDHKCAAAEEGLIAKMNDLGLNHWGEPSHKETPGE